MTVFLGQTKLHIIVTWSQVCAFARLTGREEGGEIPKRAQLRGKLFLLPIEAGVKKRGIKVDREQTFSVDRHQTNAWEQYSEDLIDTVYFHAKLPEHQRGTEPNPRGSVHFHKPVGKTEWYASYTGPYGEAESESELLQHLVMILQDEDFSRILVPEAESARRLAAWCRGLNPGESWEMEIDKEFIELFRRRALLLARLGPGDAYFDIEDDDDDFEDEEY